jgi:hypothetical protein
LHKREFEDIWECPCGKGKFLSIILLRVIKMGKSRDAKKDTKKKPTKSVKEKKQLKREKKKGK